MSSLDDLYRRVIMDHYQKPKHRGHFDESEAITVNMNNPTCGDRIQIQLKIEDGKIKDARFEGDGCSISMASASMMTDAIIGMDVEEAMKLKEIFLSMVQGMDYEQDEIDLGDIEALQGVSKFPSRVKCAALAWKAMERGVRL